MDRVLSCSDTSHRVVVPVPVSVVEWDLTLQCFYRASAGSKIGDRAWSRSSAQCTQDVAQPPDDSRHSGRGWEERRRRGASLQPDSAPRLPVPAGPIADVAVRRGCAPCARLRVGGCAGVVQSNSVHCQNVKHAPSASGRASVAGGRASSEARSARRSERTRSKENARIRQLFYVPTFRRGVRDTSTSLNVQRTSYFTLYHYLSCFNLALLSSSPSRRMRVIAKMRATSGNVVDSR